MNYKLRYLISSGLLGSLAGTTFLSGSVASGYETSFSSIRYWLGNKWDSTDDSIIDEVIDGIRKGGFLSTEVKKFSKL